MVILTPDDRPLDTQTSAPPIVPPRRPIVGLALADDDYWPRFWQQQARLQDLERLLLNVQQVNREALARLRANGPGV